MLLKDYLETLLVEEQKNNPFTYPYFQSPAGQNNQNKYTFEIFNVQKIEKKTNTW
jgi:hypothetical protein